MLSVIPQRKLVQELSRQQEGLIYLQSKLTAGIPTGRGKELEMFRYVASQAEGMNLALIADENRNNSWTMKSEAQANPALLMAPSISIVRAIAHDHDVAPRSGVQVRDMLNSFLPKPAIDLISSGELHQLQGIMDDSNVAVDSFATVFGGSESNDKSLQEFGFVRIPDWNEPQFEIYYVRLAAHFDSTRILWMHEDENTFSAEYKMKRYMIGPDVLGGLVIQNPNQARRSIKEWLDKAKIMK